MNYSLDFQFEFIFNKYDILFHLLCKFILIIHNKLKMIAKSKI